jgi:hypothetical protein
MENEEVNENELNYPSTAGSVGFGIGFLVVYIIIVFTVLGVFFTIPF